jgi:hypothetical protein
MKRSIWLTGGVLALVLFLGGAAFVGGRLLGATELTSDNQDLIVSGSGDKKIGSGTLIDVKRAAEMPDRPADVSGLFVRREDNNLFVGTGNLSGVLVDGKWEQQHEGPVKEVVTTHDTLIYRDDLLQELGGVAPSGQVQQVLKPGSVDEIGMNSFVEAWGQTRGDRLVAEVVVFTPNP